jgi:hypothetical protein
VIHANTVGVVSAVRLLWKGKDIIMIFDQLIVVQAIATCGLSWNCENQNRQCGERGNL